MAEKSRWPDLPDDCWYIYHAVVSVSSDGRAKLAVDYVELQLEVSRPSLWHSLEYLATVLSAG